MNKQQYFNAIIAAAFVILAGSPGAAWTDDAEIYVDNRELPPDSQPLVMFSLDYRPNLGAEACKGDECDFLKAEGYLAAEGPYTRFDLLRAALKKVMEPLGGLQVGLMLTHSYKNNCEGPSNVKPGCSNGGYIAMGFKEFQENDANGNKAMFHSVLDTMPVPPAPGDSLQGREMFFEFYRYLKGLSVYNGYNGFLDLGGSAAGNNNINLVPNFNHLWEGTPSESINGFGWDPTIIEGAVIQDATKGTYSQVGNYRKPTIGECAKIFTVNFMFQVANQQSNSNQEIKNTIPSLGAKCPPNATCYEEIIEYMNDADMAPLVDGHQGVTSYFVGWSPIAGTKPFNDYARAGGTGAGLAVNDDPQVLIDTLTEIFKQILSVSTSFTAAALPINSFDRAQLLDDVFLALFQPQAGEFPVANAYWWGNVKKLKLTGLDSPTDVVQLVDALDQAAAAGDGRIRFDALTFWTDPLGADVLDPARDPDPNAVAGRDGRSVNRGGAGHRIPGFPRALAHNPGLNNPASAGTQAGSGPRRIFYDSSPTTLAALNATDAVAADLSGAIGAADSAEALAVVKFMRGLNTDNDPLDWMFGAAMHSRPVAVNYGARNGHTADNPLVYVAVGSNDGALRFIRNTDTSGTELGQEIWAFIPTEVMGNVRDIVRQEVPSLRPGLEGDSTIYGFDGPSTLYVQDTGGDGTIGEAVTGVDDRAILYAGLRRGGRGYYALDVTDPDQPVLLWRIVAGETPGFDDLGWAFSQPRVGKISLPNEDDPRLVVIFAGGFDRSYDDPAGAVPAGLLGKGIYVVDALTGALIQHVIDEDNMLDSVASTVTSVDTDGDGLLDRIVVGDLGGRVWRVDMPVAVDPASWPVTLLADLGRHAVNAPPGGGTDRRFFNPPDLVQTKKTFAIDEVSSEELKFDAVVIGTGDRENPLYNTPENWFFMIRDLNIGILTDADASGPVLMPGGVDEKSLTDVTLTTGEELTIDSPGWALRLVTPGEKNLAAAITVSNTIFFTTYIPPGSGDSPTNVCGPSEGTGRLYQVSLQNANPPRNRDAVIVDTDVLDPSDRWEPLRSAGIPAEVVVIPPDRILRPDLEVAPVPITTRWRTFWYQEEDPVQ
jgi:type IV pilus assembly protein PilY1